jgi:hypothetical protein
LYRKINEVGKLALDLCGITMFLPSFAASFSNFDAQNLKAPPGAFSNRSMIILSLAAAARFGVYDMTGNYDLCQKSGELRKPRGSPSRLSISSLCTEQRQRPLKH